MTRKERIGGVIGVIMCLFIFEGLFGWLIFKHASTPPRLKVETSEVNVPFEGDIKAIELISQNQEYQEDELINPEVSFEDGVIIREKEKELIRVKEDAIKPESKNGAVEKKKLPDLIYREKVIKPEE